MHKADTCTLKMLCNTCKEIHLTILHDVNVNLHHSKKPLSPSQSRLKWKVLNSKPLADISSDLADPDLVTPNMLLMGRPDSSLPHLLLRLGKIISLTDQFCSAFINSTRQTFSPGRKGILTRIT